ncbi:MAG: homoserine kinase [Candidatus Bathyarchaeia archaeon]
MSRDGEKVTVRAPASIANLGPGFDVFALALSRPFDLLTVEATAERRISLSVTGLDSASIPLAPEANTAGRVAELFMEAFDLSVGFRIDIHKGIPPGFGLGSSGADAAAAAYALNRLLDLELPENGLISLAARGEVAASEAAHADNVSASLLGGFTIVRSYDPVDALSYEPPGNLGICIAIPRIRIPTRKTALARRSLPEKVTLSQLTHSVGHAASLVYGMMTGDIRIIGTAMNDIAIEPLRSQLIPGYDLVRAGALEQGAAGVAVCGAGPSVAAFFDTDETGPEPILEAMAVGFGKAGVESHTFTASPGRGTELVEERSWGRDGGWSDGAAWR